MLHEKEIEFKHDPEIYFHREILCLSKEQRNCDVLTISSHRNMIVQREFKFNPNLFPGKERPFK